MTFRLINKNIDAHGEITSKMFLTYEESKYLKYIIIFLVLPFLSFKHFLNSLSLSNNLFFWIYFNPRHIIEDVRLSKGI